MKKREIITDFTRGNVMKQLLIFGIPLISANFLQIIYNTVDMIVVGKVNGKIGLAAVSVGGDVTEFLTLLVMGFSNAAQVIIAQYLGAGQKKDLGKFIGTFASFLGIMAVSVTTVSMILRKHIMNWMNTPSEAYTQALAYSTVVMCGIIFIYGYNAVSAIMRGLGDSRHPFFVIACSATLNIILDIAFVYYLKLGAGGAALATVISQGCSFIGAFIFLLRNRERLGFEMHREYFRIEGVYLKKLVKLGIPMAIKGAAAGFTRLFTNAWMNSYGLIVAAVTGIGNKIFSISILISNALNTCGASMIGQNIGAENYSRVPKIMRSVWIVNISITAVIAALILAYPQQAFLLFTDDMSIMDVAMEYIPVAVLVLMSSAMRSGANSLINGSGNYYVNYSVAIFDAFVMRVGLSMFLGLGLGYGYHGFWYGSAISNYTPFVIGIVFYLSGKWKTRKYVIGD